MSSARKSLIVMLPAALVERLDARVDALLRRGRKAERDDLIAQAVEAMLREPLPEVAIAPGRADASTVAAIEARFGEELRAQVAPARQAVETAEVRARAALADLRRSVAACDREAYAAAADRSRAELVALHRATADGLGSSAALVRGAVRQAIVAVPPLADDARSRWLFGIAGRRLAPDLVTRAAATIERALDARRLLLEAATEAVERQTAVRDAAAPYADLAPVDPTADLDDDELWTHAAQAHVTELDAALDQRRAQARAILDQAEQLARHGVALVIAHAREALRHLADVPHLDHACA